MLARKCHPQEHEIWGCHEAQCPGTQGFEILTHILAQDGTELCGQMGKNVSAGAGVDHIMPHVYM